MPERRFLVLAAACCALAACNHAPTYQQPGLPVAERFDTADAPGGRRATEIGWERFFGDPQLKFLIRAALANNRDLAASVARIEQARAEGCNIDCDAYPYTAGANPLKNLLPPWVQVGTNAAMLARLALPETRARIEAEIADNGLNNWGRIPSWEAVQVSISPNLPQHAGKTIAAPSPITQRAAINCPGVSMKPPARLARPNTASPDMSMPLRPRRSDRLPEASSRAANTRL